MSDYLVDQKLTVVSRKPEIRPTLAHRRTHLFPKAEILVHALSSTNLRPAEHRHPRCTISAMSERVNSPVLQMNSSYIRVEQWGCDGVG